MRLSHPGYVELSRLDYGSREVPLIVPHMLQYDMKSILELVERKPDLKTATSTGNDFEK